ncbi:hypothetical protein FIBSPDRAFT_847891, partial [Athelia psychrophila]
MPAPAASSSSSTHHVHNSCTSASNADFYAVARDLERRLSSLRTFLDAAHELLARAKLPCSEFKRCSREIVDLIETGRETLIRAGIKLYRFTSCPPGLLPYKSVYFGLLTVLRHNRHNIEPRIRGAFSFRPIANICYIAIATLLILFETNYRPCSAAAVRAVNPLCNHALG